MYVNFAIDNGIRFTAYFYDAQADKVDTRVVTGWVMGDDGLTHAAVLIPDQGFQIRVVQIQGFLAVVPNGKEEEHKGLIDYKVELIKKQLAEAKSKAATESSANALGA